MTAGRPIGERIRALCERLELDGPQGIAELREMFPGIERSNLWKYCTRGVGLGVLTVDRTTGRAAFSAATGWREIADRRLTTRRSAVKPVEPVRQKPSCTAAARFYTVWVNA